MERGNSQPQDPHSSSNTPCHHHLLKIEQGNFVRRGIVSFYSSIPHPSLSDTADLSSSQLLCSSTPPLSQSPLLSGILRSLWWSLFELTLSLAVVSNWASFSGIPVGDFSLSLPTCSCFGVESLPLAEIWGGNSAFVSFGSLYEEISF